MEPMAFFINDPMYIPMLLLKKGEFTKKLKINKKFP